MANNPKVFMDITIDNAKAGRIVMELRADVVPKTAGIFRSFCTGEKGYTYKDCAFISIKPKSGCESSEPVNIRDKSITYGYGNKFEDENFQLKHSGPGVLSMANSGRGKFFLCTAKDESLDGKNIVIGQVLIDFMGIVEKIAKQGTTDGRPKADVIISDCGTITEWTLELTIEGRSSRNF
ncbi:uncharacterized protein LOC129588331 isoform X1 [Paramacrobiotus metropolitanus]|uniref:uncharacterized protein LOC129588331 isoform X1 n=1 Tax=Paramacrobiotus metropolitanus TaxID=2943436 RepID=UPI0024458D58|nr:uncharacterized protein LOC129588331 isoform X1 [Paramacrobiotus metropolitanus]